VGGAALPRRLYRQARKLRLDFCFGRGDFPRNGLPLGALADLESRADKSCGGFEEGMKCKLCFFGNFFFGNMRKTEEKHAEY